MKNLLKSLSGIYPKYNTNLLAQYTLNMCYIKMSENYHRRTKNVIT